ncbi:ModD protein [Prosthecochloris sp. N3]|uniref:Putative pyrophosphorylase ModD n=2 Tax=Chlorobiaceae TaxID=191412 RepID=A0ABR9XPU6_9CHLB|nr:ModD protein [Prosthecochloris ethylica]MBF0635831.1 ModD protein [Prosthecochloris ethylica]NUK47493.1 ModD protein [Prosthecochloris ethylica]RNA65860.1 ModD protein [Prosthecochloris sp. ZM_2]
MLREDVPYFDLTSRVMDLGGIDAEILFTPKSDLTVCGTEESEHIFSMLGAKTSLLKKSGERAVAGQTVLRAYGNAEQLHMGWKVAQNILEHFSGISTRTRAMVDGAAKARSTTEICGTRKHLPGIKHLSLKALCAGGGYPHRLGISDSVLIFSNHYDLLGGIETVCATLPDIKAKCPEKKVAVEVESLDHAVLAARAGADIIQIDKLPHETVAAIVAEAKAISPSVVIAAAGGINASNAEAYAAAGADVLVSSWMYFGKPADYKVIVRRV